MAVLGAAMMCAMRGIFIHPLSKEGEGEFEHVK
jgi:hypothetical protein